METPQSLKSAVDRAAACRHAGGHELAVGNAFSNAMHLIVKIVDIDFAWLDSIRLKFSNASAGDRLYRLNSCIVKT